MIRKLDHQNMGRSNLGWLQSLFHFSFADYYNPANMNFGVLRVVNDDLVQAGTGFATHPHRDMEIISYVIDGHLTHGDSMGNQNTITRGHVQYMSAGTGIQHSEYNLGEQTARFLQIWILPDRKGHVPQYGDFRFDWESRHNQWLQIVSSPDGTAPIKIHQDANLFVLELDAGNSIDFDLGSDRQAYLIQIEGTSLANGLALDTRDAAEISSETITLEAQTKSHYILIDIKQH